MISKPEETVPCYPRIVINGKLRLERRPRKGMYISIQYSL